MLKVKRDSLHQLTGERPAPRPAAPAPAPVPEQAVDPNALAELQRAVGAMASGIATLAEVVAATRPAPAPQRLQATVIRNEKTQRIERIDVDIIR